MKGQFDPIFEFNMELELIEVDCDGMRVGVFRHFLSPQISVIGQGISVRSLTLLKKCDGTCHYKPYMLKIDRT